MRKNVGYFEGTDSTLLTHLVCEGYDTIPISNGFDSHGMHVRLINEDNRIDLLVGYVHKIYAPDELAPNQTTFQDIFHICKVYGIPLLLEVPEALQDRAREVLQDPPEIVQFVDPGDTIRVAMELLESA
jgi:hypothetical protein